MKKLIILIILTILLSSCFTQSNHAQSEAVEHDIKILKGTAPEKLLKDEDAIGHTFNRPGSYAEKSKEQIRILPIDNAFTGSDLIITMEDVKYIKSDQLAVTVVMTNKTNKPIKIYNRNHPRSEQQWTFKVKSKKGQMRFIVPLHPWYAASYSPSIITIEVNGSFKQTCVLWIPGKPIKINDSRYISAPKPSIKKNTWFFTCQAYSQESIDVYKKLIKTDKFNKMPGWQKSYYLKMAKQDPRHDFIIPCDITVIFKAIKLKKNKANYFGPGISCKTLLNRR